MKVSGVTLQTDAADDHLVYEDKSFKELRMEDEEGWGETSQLALLYPGLLRPVRPQCRSALFGK